MTALVYGIVGLLLLTLFLIGKKLGGNYSRAMNLFAPGVNVVLILSLWAWLIYTSALEAFKKPGLREVVTM
eukprot:gene8830-2925_t